MLERKYYLHARLYSISNICAYVHRLSVTVSVGESIIITSVGRLVDYNTDKLLTHTLRRELKSKNYKTCFEDSYII